MKKYFLVLISSLFLSVFVVFGTEKSAPASGFNLDFGLFTVESRQLMNTYNMLRFYSISHALHEFCSFLDSNTCIDTYVFPQKENALLVSSLMRLILPSQSAGSRSCGEEMWGSFLKGQNADGAKKKVDRGKVFYNISYFLTELRKPENSEAIEDLKKKLNEIRCLAYQTFRQAIEGLTKHAIKEFEEETKNSSDSAPESGGGVNKEELDDFFVELWKKFNDLKDPSGGAGIGGAGAATSVPSAPIIVGRSSAFRKVGSKSKFGND